MIFSQTAEYALRAVVCLAYFPDAALTTRQVAGITGVPAPYQLKVLQALRSGGIVRSRRGVNGGFMLSAPPAELTLLRVLSTVAPLRPIHQHCPLQCTHCRTDHSCAFYRRLEAAITRLEQLLGGVTVAQILDQPTRLRPLGDPRLDGPPRATLPPDGGSGEGRRGDAETR